MKQWQRRGMLAERALRVETVETAAQASRARELIATPNTCREVSRALAWVALGGLALALCIAAALGSL